ncbi:MAG: 50S ribosomal protein L5 [Candidatus Woykebacteria bacterium RBG_16_44_10]|uniref:Large ribosomal subunit protein uL5 n=1 Tax=Candidatus Woykebacteria bacterium RBG_16_44_10 TaxID=1802597 RepID=A0A1G1WED4_9BACT|nr:MAG: 50S ribosomal protein L5 [Candidatus Woykebacteria bacterium RBG_16_44_10]
MQTANLKQNLKEKYLTKVRLSLMKEFDKKNIYEVPVIEKVVLNTGFGRLAPNEKMKEQIVGSLAKISGQRPFLTKAKKAIAGFKIRKGQMIGAKVTLRGERMYHFLEKLVSIVLPRLRDFRGVKDTAFDKKGNYTLGFREITVFPEIEYVKEESPIGLEVTIQTRARTLDEAKNLLTKIGVPFTKPKIKKEEAGVKAS